MRARASAVSMSLVLSVLVLVAQPASAAVEDCPEGSVCVWTEPEYSGRIATTDRPTAECVRGISRSGLNRSRDLTIVLWSEPDCSGESLRLAPGQQSSIEDPAWRSVAIEKARNCLVGKLLCS